MDQNRRNGAKWARIQNEIEQRGDWYRLTNWTGKPKTPSILEETEQNKIYNCSLGPLGIQ